MCGVIHGLQWPAYGDFDAATRVFGQYARWLDLLLPRLERVAEQARALGAVPQLLIDGVVTELNDGDAVFETASPPALVHGDLHPGNILLDQRGETWHIAAILNWEASLTADAAWEFACLSFRRSSPNLVRDALVYGYRERHPIQADLRTRIHLYLLLFHLEAAVSAYAQPASERQGVGAHEVALRRLLAK